MIKSDRYGEFSNEYTKHRESEQFCRMSQRLDNYRDNFNINRSFMTIGNPDCNRCSIRKIFHPKPYATARTNQPVRYASQPKTASVRESRNFSPLANNEPLNQEVNREKGIVSQNESYAVPTMSSTIYQRFLVNQEDFGRVSEVKAFIPCNPSEAKKTIYGGDEFDVPYRKPKPPFVDRSLHSSPFKVRKIKGTTDFIKRKVFLNQNNSFSTFLRKTNQPELLTVLNNYKTYNRILRKEFLRGENSSTYRSQRKPQNIYSPKNKLDFIGNVLR